MTMIRKLAGMAALLGAAPLAAQTPPPAPPPPPPVATFAVTPIPPTDPARLAAARPVIDRVWPAGTYAQMMHVMMGPFMQGTIAQTMKMRLSDLIPGMGAAAGKKPEANQTIGEMVAANDPYFQQRMTLTMNAVADEMAKLVTQIEPDVREALAHSYARRFTVVQLGELDRFFATPTGAAYAADSHTLMMSPDMAQAMQSFTPKLIKAMPDFIAKVTAATKDLPPPGKGKAATPPVIPPPPPPPAKTP